MRYVVVSGYISSGSSIIVDLLREVSGYYIWDREFKLFTLPGGLLDLERALFDHWDPWKCGDAFEQFMNLCSLDGGIISKSDSGSFRECFIVATEQFLKRIHGYTYSFGSAVYKTKGEVKRCIKYKDFFVSTGTYEAKRDIVFSDISHAEFIKAVREYIDNVFEYVDGKYYSSVVLDQGIRPYQADCFERFFPDGKMIVVDRNPLDSAVSMLENGKGIGLELRKNLDADLYTRWFKKMRCACGNSNRDSHLYMYYEEVIKNYNEKCKELFSFLEIDEHNHITPQRYFNPSISVERIDKWKSYAGGGWHNEQQWTEFCLQVMENT